MNPERFDWRARPDADALLTELWPTNKHIQDVLAEMQQRLRCYTLTKNAMCGRAKRLGLPPRTLREALERKPQPKRPNSRRRKPAPDYRAQVRVLVKAVAESEPWQDENPESVPSEQEIEQCSPPPPERLPPPPPLLSRHSCMWPIGEPGEKDFRFCEEPAAFGKPYCPDHSKTAYRGKPASKSIDKNAGCGENLNVPHGA
jgi:GcrA cell cycle regulator